MNKPEWIFIAIGCLASIVSGGVQPAFAIVFSKVIAVFSLCERSEQEKKITLYVILFVVFGIVTLISNFLQVLKLKTSISYDTKYYIFYLKQKKELFIWIGG